MTIDMDYTAKVLDNIWSTLLVGLVYKYHSDSCFKAVEDEVP